MIEVQIRDSETGQKKIVAFQRAMLEDTPMRPACMVMINRSLNEVSGLPVELNTYDLVIKSDNEDPSAK